MPSDRIEKWVPGLQVLRTYKKEWLQSDLIAGVSVAAVAIPIGIAYAQLAGFSPVAGLYSCILPAIAYAIFGTSRQLVVNPDSAACAIIAATIAPMAAAGSERYEDLSVVLAILAGLVCIGAGIARLGVVADFLSRPILTGYLNGIALSIIVSQLDVICGFSIASAGFFRSLFDTVSRLSETHLPTLMLGLGLFILLRVLKRVLPKIPAPLVAVVLGIAAVYFLDLVPKGVGIVGDVPSGFPIPAVPDVAFSDLAGLLPGAFTIALISFCSMMPTARGFATKNGYSIDPNQDLIALGVADVASGLTRGFAVSGADSRTAVADASGGKTQVTSIAAAVAITFVLFFLTKPLSYLPTAALAAILISSAIGLFDLASLKRYYKVSKPEFRHSLVAMLGVMTIGVLPGILIAVGLALLKLVLISSRPRDAVLGFIHGHSGLVTVERDAGGKTVPGLLIYRWEAAIVFYNSYYFRERVRSVIAMETPRPRWFILDAESAPMLDITGAAAVGALREELAAQGISFGIARAKGLFLGMLELSGVAADIGPERMFARVSDAAESYVEQHEDSRDWLDAAPIK